MNIVKVILDYLLGSGLGDLSSLLGESEAKTESAVKAAVPALLSGLSGLASSDDGTQKLVSTLRQFDPGDLDNLDNVLTGDTKSVADRGGSLLSSLFGSGVLSAIINAVGRYAGLGQGSSKSLINYLAPLVLGAIAKQFIGKTINAGALTDLFAGQKKNIADAIPSGLSLADVPGLERVGAATGAAYDTAKSGYRETQKAASEGMNWLWPLLGIAAVAVVGYLLWSNMQGGPDVASLTKDLTGNFSTLTETLEGITDAASAEAALPKLTELSGKFAAMKALVDKLPEAGKNEIVDLIRSSMGNLGSELSRVLMIPGISDEMRPALEGLVKDVASVGGLPGEEFALPSVEVTQLGRELSGMFSSLTETLSGVTDAASADAALPKLTEISGQLDASKSSWDGLPEAGKSTIGSLVGTALAGLRTLVDKVLSAAGVEGVLKPVVDEIMAKLAGLAG